MNLGRDRFRKFGVLLLVLVGCKSPPQPLGKFERESWKADCVSEISQSPHRRGKDPRYPVPVRELTFQNATQTYQCAPPGWVVQTDESKRIVGLCVDDYFAKLPRETALDRARTILGRHLEASLVDDMTSGECASVEDLPHGLLRWLQPQPKVVNDDGTLSPPAKSGAHWACCWEVKE